jgi:hypothetical protein
MGHLFLGFFADRGLRCLQPELLPLRLELLRKVFLIPAAIRGKQFDPYYVEKNFRRVGSDLHTRCRRSMDDHLIRMPRLRLPPNHTAFILAMTPFLPRASRGH